MFVKALLAATIGATVVVAQSCDFTWTALAGETCAELATDFELTLAQFIALNPSVGANCVNGLVVGTAYCVLGTPAATTSSISTTTSTTLATSSTTLVTSTLTTLVPSTTTNTATGTPGPSPTQSGIAANCDNFYLVPAGASCSAIASQFSISLSDFYSWNPAVGSTCATLFADYYVCVGVPGATTVTATATTTAASGPSPTQTGIASTCDAWYLVESGNTCSAIATAFELALTDFYSMNPAVGSDCSTLFLGYFVCVGLTGTAAPTTITGALPSPTSTTPSPTQTGIISTCNKWYEAQSGDTCANIATSEGITLANFYAWNPAVGSTCATLFADYYYCVGI